MSFRPQAAPCPAFADAAPLVPDNFLLTPADTVPGLRRFGPDGQPTASRKRCYTPLAHATLAPVLPLSLAGVRLSVPQPLHDMLGPLFAQAQR